MNPTGCAMRISSRKRISHNFRYNFQVHLSQKTMNLLLIFTFVFGLNTSCWTPAPTSNAAPISHDIWNGLVKKYVNNDGMVNYKGFQKDEATLDKYLELVQNNAPDEKTWSKDEQLAYWINAYNAFTVKLILNNYDKGLKSIKDIGASIKIPFVNTPWDVKFIEIGGKKMDLNNIEHGIVRKKFDNEFRIHFALVCAAKSCPKLRNEAYIADRLNAQLEDQGKDFLNDPKKNMISKTNASLSKILAIWYKGDFTKGGKDLVDIVNRFSKTQLDKGASVSSLDYNWDLNEQ